MRLYLQKPKSPWLCFIMWKSGDTVLYKVYNWHWQLIHLLIYFYFRHKEKSPDTEEDGNKAKKFISDFPTCVEWQSCWHPDIFHGVKLFPSMSFFAFLLLLRGVALLTVWLYYNKQSLMTPWRPLYPYCPPSFSLSLSRSLCLSFSACSSGSSSAAN